MIHTWFLSVDDAETYAKNLFGIDSWQIKEKRLTEKFLRKSEYVERILEELGKQFQKPEVIQ